MDSREIFNKILNFEPVDRTLNWEFGYWGEPINRWYKEGLPRVHGLPWELTYGEAVVGPGHPWPLPSMDENILRDYDISLFFNFDSGIDLIPFDSWIYPKYELQILREDKLHREIVDTDGIRKWTYKDDSSMPQFLAWPVKDEKDWEELKRERFQLRFSDRLKGNIVDLKEKFKNRDFPLGLFGDPVGFYGSIRFLMGELNLLYAYYDRPTLVKDILNFLADFWVDCSSELLSYFDVDAVFFWEDMSGKNGQLISPVQFREFMMPPYKKVIRALKSMGVKHFIVDTDGKVDELIPLFIDCGITGMYPFEQQAGNDIIEIRSSYPRFQILGGIDKNKLLLDKEAIRDELRCLDEMIKLGGYIPFADHIIQPNVSWENFKFYREELKDIIFNTKVLE